MDCDPSRGYDLLGMVLYAGEPFHDASGTLLRPRASQTGREAVVAARPFRSVDDLARRVPELHKDEMTRLAEVGALNWIGATNRRDALWQAEQAVRRPGELFEELELDPTACPLQPCPLQAMTSGERLDADYSGTGLTLSRHPMVFRRAEMQRLGVLRAMDLLGVRNGRLVRVAGNVIVRQRPGTAKGFLFLSLEDETGIANVIVLPDLFERFREPLVREPFLLVTGVLQKQDGAVSVRARRVEALPTSLAEASAAQSSRDFR
jgi:error-prone DNA polymerase